MACHLRYKPDAYGGRFTSIRYPVHKNVSRELAEKMRAAMPDPDLFEIVEETP